jgi:hypothetical protein
MRPKLPEPLEEKVQVPQVLGLGAADDDYVIQIGEDEVEAGQHPGHHPLGHIAGIREPERQSVELKQPEGIVTAIFCISAGCIKIW